MTSYQGDGPISLVLAPTRELVQQIAQEAKKVAKQFGLQVLAAFGGQNRYEQVKALKAGIDIVVGTPGRIIDLAKDKSLTFERVTYLVLDEADNMLSMGFSLQVNSILGHVRPDRQTCLFSATMKRKIEKLADDACSHPVRVIVGEIGEANRDVQQYIEVLPDYDIKNKWLMLRIVEFVSAGNLLIFCSKKTEAEFLYRDLESRGHKSLLIHGDIHQDKRNDVISKFRKQEARILVATDVAARGLDIPSVKTVVSYSVAKDLDTHTHRIGRTGRAGTKGEAYTLLLPTQKYYAGLIVKSLESAGQDVPDHIMSLANQDKSFQLSRQLARGDDSQVKDRSGLGFGRRRRPNPAEFQQAQSSKDGAPKPKRNRWDKQ